MNLKDTWFEAEAVVKKIQDNSPDFFQQLKKVLVTIILFAICVVIFAVFLIWSLANEGVIFLFEKFKKKENPTIIEAEEYTEHSDYSGAPDPNLEIPKEGIKDPASELRKKGML
jgi:flagellar biosynthesis/type III secretory pathway M-ring protein FliF/YscJ